MASPTLSPDSSSQEALSAPTCSPTSDSENLSPDELELLAKLEEQNRLLEADSKSMRSMNGSRRNSGSSLVSSSSASSNLSHLEEDTWILWGRIANEWEEWRRRKEKLLKELIRKGIPHHFRAIVWQLLCSATDMPVKNQYSELLKMSSPCEKLIRRDIARTYPEHEFFKGQDSLGQEVLFNVMKAYSLVDREVGYCQGSAFIVGLLLMQMPEEEAFCVFVRLMQEYRLRELFKPSMAELGLCIYQFEYMLQEQLPDLNTHFRSQSFHTSMYASSWFLTLFLTTFPLPVATRVFDIFMYEVRTDGAWGGKRYFQRVIPHQFDSCPDKLVLKAYQVKYNPKKMKRLEKEYAAMKSKEMEEQIEIKRLRTENRLLKQREGRGHCGDMVTMGCDPPCGDLQKAQSTIRLATGAENPRLTEDFVSHLETELEQSRLRETETLGALREMQDKVLDMEKRGEGDGGGGQEGEKGRPRPTGAASLHIPMETPSQAFWVPPQLLSDLASTPLSHGAPRGRKAPRDPFTHSAGGQLNHSDSSQYIRELKDHIEELKAEVRLLKGPPPFEDPLAFDGLSLARHLDEDSLPSSDEELLGVGVGVGAALQDALYPLSPRDARFFRRLERPAKDSEGSSDSDADELAAPYSQGLDN
uniref:Ecotropic viral integration site 5 like n=1 Tax=Nomascus leucogenys TaxID=61853 RepID=G1QKJ8_NOMLE